MELLEALDQAMMAMGDRVEELEDQKIGTNVNTDEQEQLAGMIDDLIEARHTVGVVINALQQAGDSEVLGIFSGRILDAVEKENLLKELQNGIYVLDTNNAYVQERHDKDAWAWARTKAWRLVLVDLLQRFLR